MKRFLFLSILVCVFHWASAQEFKPRHYKTFGRLGLEISPVTSYSPQSINTLYEILKQVKVNKNNATGWSVRLKQLVSQVGQLRPFSFFEPDMRINGALLQPVDEYRQTVGL